MAGNVLLLLLISVLQGQDYRGEAVIKAAPQRAERIEFGKFEIQRIVFGREGPMHVARRTAPVQGREYLVRANIYGIREAASIRFELVDSAGRATQTIGMWKLTDSPEGGDFMGTLTVPSHPFRVAAEGVDRGGSPFRVLSPVVIRPVSSGGVEEPVLPAGVPPEYAGRLKAELDRYENEIRQRAALVGPISLLRLQVSRVAYEPFRSADGSPLGVRLRYSVRFESDTVIEVIPHVAPQFQEYAWRGMVTMKVLQGTITPSPGLEGGTSLRDVIVYSAKGRFQAGVTYTLSIDMIPDYMLRGEVSGRYCFFGKKFESRQATWNALASSSTAVPYSLGIFSLGYAADIPAFYPQRTLYESFLKGGAVDCGETPNIRF